MNICELCKSLDELEREYPDDPHHGTLLTCECGAEYYEEYNLLIRTCNKEARMNHPELRPI